MKRLKNILLSMEPNTATYTEMYNGSITFIDTLRPNSPAVQAEDPTYYKGNVGYKITCAHKSAQDKPTIDIVIPTEEIFYEFKGADCLKRLKYHLLKMENDTATYTQMYEGEAVIPPGTFGNPKPNAEIYSDPTYWHEDIGFEIQSSGKSAKDKPTLTCKIPLERLGFDVYEKASADFCLREFAKYIDGLNEPLYNRSRPDNENGKYYICKPGGEVLIRNTAYFALCPRKDYENGSGSTVYLLNDGVTRLPKMCLCIKLQVQLPKRRLRKAVQMLCRDLPDAVDRFIADFDIVRLNRALELAEKQAAIRNWLKESEYCAFIANGSILPRAKGTDMPMTNAIPFKSAESDEIEICGIAGMGIKRGVTVITGGGYSGKSTVLDAISAGIYDHCPGDGRELCITDESAVTISAEDGRSVKNLNISPFIKWLPNGDTNDFLTEHASGSTSQAANIMEAVDFGAKLLLIDEDRSATNFMIRDNMMKTLIAKEPITPFTDRANELWSERGVSTVLVIGGSGEYLSVADRIYMMEDYIIQNVTDKAKEICKSVTVLPPQKGDWTQRRRLTSRGFSSYPKGSGSEKLAVSDMGFILIGDEKIDVRGLHDIVTSRQLESLGFMLRHLEISNREHIIDIRKRIDELYKRIDEEGLDLVYSAYFTTCERFLDMPRKQELFSLICRMRNIAFVNDIER